MIATTVTVNLITVLVVLGIIALILFIAKKL